MLFMSEVARGESFSSETQALLSPGTSGSLKGFLGNTYVCPGVLWIDMTGRHSAKIPEPHSWWLYFGLLSYLSYLPKNGFHAVAYISKAS